MIYGWVLTATKEYNSFRRRIEINSDGDMGHVAKIFFYQYTV